MKRRNFIKALFGVAAAPIIAEKVIGFEHSLKSNAFARELESGFTSDTVTINGVTYEMDKGTRIAIGMEAGRATHGTHSISIGPNAGKV